VGVVPTVSTDIPQSSSEQQNERANLIFIKLFFVQGIFSHFLWVFYSPF